ncbi:MAG: hypothetical protein P4L79_01560 [Legionella sp.]|uniref:hypothetical protein n=1 Tax=Legionella sp. TaxID=459 RepID=UPI00284E606E|nr:hypothetical protein [Legionella sp.]
MKVYIHIKIQNYFNLYGGGSLSFSINEVANTFRLPEDGPSEEGLTYSELEDDFRQYYHHRLIKMNFASQQDKEEFLSSYEKILQEKFGGKYYSAKDSEASMKKLHDELVGLVQKSKMNYSSKTLLFFAAEATSSAPAGIVNSEIRESAPTI